MRHLRSTYIILVTTVFTLLANAEPARAGVNVGEITIKALDLTAGNVFRGTGIILGSIWNFVTGVIGGVLGAAAGRIAKALISVVAGILNYIILIIGRVLFGIAQWIIDFAIKLTTDLSNSLVVRKGFDIVLDVANLGLVVAIIVIAFMVMLRRTGADKLLLRFIAIALLINFSFYIVTNLVIKPVDKIVIILNDASNFDDNSFASVFMPDTDWGVVFDDINDLVDYDEGVPGWAVDIAITLLSVLFSVTFVLLGAFALFAFALMLFIRYVALSFLIIIMPIALLSWVFPNLKIAGGTIWSQWSQSFTRWLLFAPIVMFFFFIAIRAAAGDSNVLSEGTGINDLERGAAALGDMIIILGFLMGGLIVANKMSITGASYAMKLAKDTGKKIRGRAWEKTKIAGTYALRRPGDEFDKDKNRLREPTATERLQRAGRDSSKLVKAILSPARKAGNLVAGVRIAGEKAYKTSKERIDKLSLEEQEKRFDSADGPEQLAILTNIFGEIKKLNDKEEKGIKDKGPTFTLEPDDQRRLNKLKAIRGRIGEEPKLRERMEKLRGLYAQNELRVGKKAEELAEAFREEGKTSAEPSTPAPPTPPATPTTPTP